MKEHLSWKGAAGAFKLPLPVINNGLG